MKHPVDLCEVLLQVIEEMDVCDILALQAILRSFATISQPDLRKVIVILSTHTGWDLDTLEHRPDDELVEWFKTPQGHRAAQVGARPGAPGGKRDRNVGRAIGRTERPGGGLCAPARPAARASACNPTDSPRQSAGTRQKKPPPFFPGHGVSRACLKVWQAAKLYGRIHGLAIKCQHHSVGRVTTSAITVPDLTVASRAVPGVYRTPLIGRCTHTSPCTMPSLTRR